MRRRQLLWLLVLCLAVPACSRDLVQTPAMITILTEEMPAADAAAADAGPLVSDTRLLAPVVRVTSRLIAAARQSEYGSRVRAWCWVIAVRNAPTLSRSFVRPNGGIVVSTGTFRLAETEAGLAAVLGHEFVHALALDDAPASPVCMSTTEPPPALSSFAEELKTDEMGLTLMADAGYDPRELLALWERMKREDGHAGDAVLSHLIYDRRMERIAQWLPQALMRYQHANRAPHKLLPLN